MLFSENKLNMATPTRRFSNLEAAAFFVVYAYGFKQNDTRRSSNLA